MAEAPSTEKKGSSLLVRFILFILLAGAVLFGLQKMGVKSVNVQEDSEITNDPHPGY